LSPELLLALREIQSPVLFSKGAYLYEQGSPVKGAYFVETGDVRILLAASQGQRQLIEVVGPGTTLGLAETMSGEDYRITAEAGSLTTASFVAREALLIFLRDHANFCAEIVRLLSEELNRLYHKFRSISAHPGRPRRRDRNEQLN
jgi:CRP-like cAMP-binding protein